MTALISHRLQEAVFAILAEDQTLKLKIKGVYDQPAASAQYPYVSLGETNVQSADLKDRAGVSINFTVSIWSVEPSQMQTKELMADVDTLLNRTSLDLVGFDGCVIQMENASVQRQFGSASALYQGRLNYSCVLYEM